MSKVIAKLEAVENIENWLCPVAKLSAGWGIRTDQPISCVWQLTQVLCNLSKQEVAISENGSHHYLNVEV